MIKKKHYDERIMHTAKFARLLCSPFSFLIGIAPAVQLIGTPFPDESILELTFQAFNAGFSFFDNRFIK